MGIAQKIRAAFERYDDSVRPHAFLVAYAPVGSFGDVQAKADCILKEMVGGPVDDDGSIPSLPQPTRDLARLCRNNVMVTKQGDYDVAVFRPTDGDFDQEREYLVRCLNESMPVDLSYGVVVTTGGGLPPVVEQAIGSPWSDTPAIAVGMASAEGAGFPVVWPTAGDRGGVLGYCGQDVAIFGAGKDAVDAKAEAWTARRELGPGMGRLRADGFTVAPADGIVVGFDGLENDLPRSSPAFAR